MPDQRGYKDIVKALDGSNGIVYLMFLGAEKYAAQIQDPLIKSKFFKHKENVNQAFSRLTKKHGDLFLSFIRREKAPGNPGIYTANIEPIFVTLRQFDIKYNEERLQAFFKHLSFLNVHFPEFLVKQQIEQYKSFSSKKLHWPITLGFYFCFLFYLLEPMITDRLTQKEREILKKLRSTLTKNSAYLSKLKPWNEQLERFIAEYPGGLDFFLKEIGNILLFASLKFMFGPLSSRVFSLFESILGVYDTDEKAHG